MKTIKAISLLLALVFTFSLASCKKKEEAPPDDSTGESTAAATTDEEKNEPKEPEFTNPLTGLEADKDLSRARPVSIMVNNIAVSLPQEGIAQADIMYECLAEGGITRLMMIVTDYESLTKTGSVRSARDYYIDLAESYNCIFLHAGGSTYAYDTLRARGTNNIDGVNGPGSLYSTSKTFFRDPDRVNKYSYEHTLMIVNGAGIKAAAEMLNYPTEKASGYEEPVFFAPWGTKAEGKSKATHAYVEMSNYQKVDYVYDAETELYKRYQYSGQKHIDNTTGEQLAYTNVLLLFADSGAITGDEKNRIWVQTTGENSGWYLTGGTYEKIKWKKDSHDSVIRYYKEDGSELRLNRGKTMINVIPSYNESLVVLDDNTAAFN